jgi:hypothetical protein
MLDPGLALGEKRDARDFRYGARRDQIGDERFERGYTDSRADRADDVGFRDKSFDRGVFESDRGFGLSADQFNESKRQFGLNYGLDSRRTSVAEAAAAAEAQQQGAGVAPALAGLPPGVQSAIVTKELTGLDTSEEAVGKARGAANIARAFMADSQGYGALGGGPLADIGQAASQKTAQLKGHTARMIPMMRSPGEGEMTDSDAKRYELSVVSINKGRSANEAVVRDLERVEANEVARDKFLREWQAQNGYGSVSQAKLLWQQYADAEPIFDPATGKPRERPTIYDYLGGGSAAPTGAGLEASSDDDLFMILRGN